MSETVAPTRRPPPPPLSPSSAGKPYESGVGIKDCVFLVTGGAGYLGRTLMKQLLAAGAREVRLSEWGESLPVSGYEVRTFDVSLPSTVQSTADADPRVVRVLGDVRNRDAVLKACEGVDCIFHIASFGMSGKEMVEARKIREVNVGGTRTLLQGALDAGVSRLVYTSTYNVVYGGRPIKGGDEILPYFPLDKHVDEYSRSKALAEMEVLRADGTKLRAGPPGGELSTCAIRPAAIYGPGEERHFPRIAALIRAGMFQFCIGSKDTLVDWVHCASLADAHIKAAVGLRTGVAAGQAYFISDGEPVNQFEFLEPLVAALGRPMPTVYIPVWVLMPVALIIQAVCGLLARVGIRVQPLLLPAEVYKVGRSHWFRIDKAKQELGYAPLVSPKQGIEETVAALVARHTEEEESAVARPHIVWWVLILAGMALLAIAAFGPRQLPTELLLVRRLGIRLFGSVEGLQVVWWLACAAHAVEGGVAWKIARAHERHNATRWWFQTILLGYPSLRLLRRRHAKVAKK